MLRGHPKILKRPKLHTLPNICKFWEDTVLVVSSQDDVKQVILFIRAIFAKVVKFLVFVTEEVKFHDACPFGYFDGKNFRFAGL